MASASRVPVIIDTDPGVDDIVAILLALASPELEILAFVISYGNTDIDASYLNILKAYQAIAKHLEIHPEDTLRFPNFRPDSPPLLVRGVSAPLEGSLHSAQYFHGRDGLGDIAARHEELDLDNSFVEEGLGRSLTVVKEEGLDAIIRTIRSRPARSITYVALGPLTNIAMLVQKDRQAICSLIGRFVAMGGAVDVPGNTSPVAEFNFFADPFAVKRLLVSENLTELPLERFLLLPLDITTPHEIPFPVYRQFVDPSFSTTAEPSIASNKAPLTHFTSSFLERTREIMLEFGKDAMELHDITAIWCAICGTPPYLKPTDNAYPLPTGWRARKRVFDIERTGEITRGMLVVDRREDASAYAPGANRAEVQRLLEGTLHTKDGLWESTTVPAEVEVEMKPEIKDSPHGVWCVTDTPGPEVLLRLLFRRVWGVELA
ncbi:hypothetical protein D9611_000107 [Ephemerocybe angulata]|uniref:Inosine/uridine-preferring nucleoside hydrolase domain-containing protein n=1 Tax=Ephemerocybe angulata TaxID=980116 RepID=A0A8H5F726_9AGAR|nr:hypothetical protein D9611_000107 [Tulosesus angulatus]